MKSPLEWREFYKGNMRSKDFNVWSKPNMEDEFPVTIFDAGDTKEKEAKEILLYDLFKKMLSLIRF